MYHLNGEILHPFPGFVAVSGTFSLCGDGSSTFCGGFQDIFFLRWRFLLILWRFPGHFPLRRWFLHVLWRFWDIFPPRRHFLLILWRFPGHFPSSAAFSPGFAPKTRMFPYRHNIFSRNCGVFQDIFFLRRRFLLVLRRFPGHFPSAEMVSPRFRGEMRMFCCW